MSDRFLRFALVLALLTAGTAALRPTQALGTTLRVGSDVSGAPFEFYDALHRMRGFDLDLLAAMQPKLGRPVRVINHRFEDLIPAVRRGEFDAAMSAMSDTRAREKLVDFVDYFLAGGGIMVPAANPHRIFALDALCGYSVSVESGTAYQGAIQAQSKACRAVGLGRIRVVSAGTDDEAYAALLAGRVDAYVTDYPVGAYRVRTHRDDTRYVMAGRQFSVVPYGIAVAKSNPTLRAQLAAALVAVIADGTYDRLLKKWNLTQGALRSVPINAGTLFER